MHTDMHEHMHTQRITTFSLKRYISLQQHSVRYGAFYTLKIYNNKAIFSY